VADGVNDGLPVGVAVIELVDVAESVDVSELETDDVLVLLAVGVGRGENSDSGCDAARVTPRKS